MDTKFGILVHGKTKCYEFYFKGNPQYLVEWQQQGLNVYVVHPWSPTTLKGWWIKFKCFLDEWQKEDFQLTVRGLTRTYSFNFQGYEKYWRQWVEEEGLEITMILNSVPQWVCRWNLVTEWCVLQDLFRFKNPMRNWR